MATTNRVSFYLNGTQVNVDDPSPDLLLIDYLRSSHVGLTGAKKGCGQGGCGACTVILSTWETKAKTPTHRSINSCLRPVCSLQGLSITTIEGTGAARRLPPAHPVHVQSATRSGVPFIATTGPHIIAAQEKTQECRQAALTKTSGRRLKSSSAYQHNAPVNPVAHRLAVNNGTQCGYCSTGFVMNMSALLADNPKPTKKQIEQAFDGNICRCTGYRPILTAMKTFANDWSARDEKKRMSCVIDDQVKANVPESKVILPIAKGANGKVFGVNLSFKERVFLSPKNVAELIEIFGRYSAKDIYLIHANTSFGVYTREFLTRKVLVNISTLKVLAKRRVSDSSITVGAGTTYSDFIKLLEEVINKRKLSQTTAVGALHFMARRTAGTIVRNAATLGGNSMLVLKHIATSDEEPFPSDLFTVLSALGATLEHVDLGTGKKQRNTVEQLVNLVIKNPRLAHKILLLSYTIPCKSNVRIVLAQKVAIRDINAHSIVNSTTVFSLSDTLKLKDVNLTFGAIAPYPWRPKATEQLMRNKVLSLDHFDEIAQQLNKDIKAELKHNAKRVAGLSFDGYTDTYRIELATSFVYKAIVNALEQANCSVLPEDIRSSGQITWGNWPVSAGQQFYKNQDFKAPVSQPYIKLMALYQTLGQVRYTHEMQVPPTTVNGSFVQSQRALAKFVYKDPQTGKDGLTADQLTRTLRSRFPALIKIITCDDLPVGGVNLQGMGGDQPVFAEGQVNYVGQSIALVIAANETDANEIALFISDECVHYYRINWPIKWQKPVLSLDEAITRGSVFPDAPSAASFVTHIWKIIRPASTFGWLGKYKSAPDRAIDESATSIDGSKCIVVKNSQTTGGQIHFYMETQSCVAIPAEADRMRLYPSSQSPMGMHQIACSVLGVEHHQVEVGIRQLGGAYGGKTEQAKFVAAATVIAAKNMNTPVRVVMPRESDSAMTGKRHPYFGQYQIAIDDGKTIKTNKGLIRGLDLNFWGDGGAFYDCSFIVSNCLQLRVDNAYRIPNFSSTLDVCRTNSAPNTAFRSFGDIQGKLIIENAVDDAAYSIGMDPDTVREKNLYQRGDVTPFGQALTYCYIGDVWQYLKKVSNIKTRKEKVKKFNKANKWRKRGIYMLPVKYGSGYNLVQLEQASALVSVYSSDGTIIINQGGVDMGQGAMTKMEQIASYILNVPMDMIQMQSAKTDIIPNPTSTGGSTGTAYNGLAVKQTCEKLRGRLLEFGYSVLKKNGDEWCRNNHVDFWNYGAEGWAATPKAGAKAKTRPKMIWQNLVALAYRERISLIECFNAKIPGGTDPIPQVFYKPISQQEALPGIKIPKYKPDDPPIGGEVDSFTGWTYSAACTEVEVDILTGEVKIIRADVLYDMGWSLNPALDIGQVEGAFIQGVGYVMTEKLVFEPKGDTQGELNSLNTWRYKPPATTNVPLEFNVHLFPRDETSVPENPNELMSAKEVGEPPVVLAASVFFAIKAAVRASRVERGLSGLFRMDAPATVQEVRKACEVNF